MNAHIRSDRQAYMQYMMKEHCSSLYISVGLFFSVDIMVFDFLHFVFFQVQYKHYCWKHYVERLRTQKFLHIFFTGVFNRIENKEVGTICCEVRIPMKKTKILMEVSKNDYLDLDSTILFWKKTKIIMEAFLQYHEKTTEKQGFGHKISWK